MMATLFMASVKKSIYDILKLTFFQLLSTLFFNAFEANIYLVGI